MQLYYGDIIPYLAPLSKGLAISLGISIAALGGGGALGILLYTCRASASRTVRAAATTYVEVVRNTPLLLQLYLVYFALPQAGVNLAPIAAGVVALTAAHHAPSATSACGQAPLPWASLVTVAAGGARLT